MVTEQQAVGSPSMPPGTCSSPSGSV